MMVALMSLVSQGPLRFHGTGWECLRCTKASIAGQADGEAFVDSVILAAFGRASGPARLVYALTYTEQRQSTMAAR